eukprot:11584756-Alexandrium_andersonii.AAC.1
MCARGIWKTHVCLCRNATLAGCWRGSAVHLFRLFLPRCADWRVADDGNDRSCHANLDTPARAPQTQHKC